MKDILFPVLLSALVIPGAGQIYNQEKPKGVVLIALFFLVMLGFMISFSVSLSPLLPADRVISPEQARDLAERILSEKNGFFTTSFYLTGAIWIYGIIDAYLGAVDRLKARAKAAGETPPS